MFWEDFLEEFFWRIFHRMMRWFYEGCSRLNSTYFCGPQYNTLPSTNLYAKKDWGVLEFQIKNRLVFFKNCSSQFLSDWELDNPVFCTEELSCLYASVMSDALTPSNGGKWEIMHYVHLVSSHLQPLGGVGVYDIELSSLQKT